MGARSQVSKEDGGGLPVPIDFSTADRIFVYVERQVVT